MTRSALGAEELRDYFRSYAQASDLNRSIRLKTPVRKVTPELLDRIITEHLENGTPVQEYVYHQG